jgi:hypothetical protein
MKPLASHDRFDYTGIGDRTRLRRRWPGGAGLAVYLGFNLEHFAFGEGLGAMIGPASPQPDVLNYAWREYGNRVGAWRCLELFDRLGLPAAALINTALYDHCPELVAACVARGDELVGHGHSNAERQGGLDEAAERALLVHCRERIEACSGHKCRVGSRRGFQKAFARPTCWPKPATAIRSTGATTTNRCRCARAADPHCGRCRIRRSSTTFR